MSERLFLSSFSRGIPAHLHNPRLSPPAVTVQSVLPRLAAESAEAVNKDWTLSSETEIRDTVLIVQSSTLEASLVRNNCISFL